MSSAAPALCSDCGHVGTHPTVALDRFRPEGPSGFLDIADRTHTTRAAAESGTCAARRGAVVATPHT